MIKAIALFSGGLDSTLAIKLLLAQGIDILAVNFTSPFCTCTAKKSGCKSIAFKLANELGIPLRLIFRGMDYLKMVENPRFGYGRGLNPCLDCRIYYFNKAKEIMKKVGAQFLISGEVLGQRPMSQRRDTINIIDRETGLKGYILRPLSAQLLPPTVPEEKGWVKRDKLLNISGRSRKEQLKLAKHYQLKDFACPAGGCLLTDQNFAAKLKDLFKFQPNYNLVDVYLLKIGRHFRLSEKTKLIIGRDKEENQKLMRYGKNSEKFSLFSPDNFPGPSALLVGELNEEVLKKTSQIIFSYSKKRGLKKFLNFYFRGELKKVTLVTGEIKEEEVKSLFACLLI